MNKLIVFITGLCMLALISTPTISFATTASPAIPTWKTCTGSQLRGSTQITAQIGQNTVIVDWTSPRNSYENYEGCQSEPFTQSSLTVYVNHPNLIPVPTEVICHSLSCSDGFTLLVSIFVGKGYITEPYKLVYGDSVVVEISDTYGSFFIHSGSYTLKVTS